MSDILEYDSELGRYYVNETKLFNYLWTDENPSSKLMKLIEIYDPSLALYPKINVGFYTAAFSGIPYKIGIGKKSLYFLLYKDIQDSRDAYDVWKENIDQKLADEIPYYYRFPLTDISFDGMFGDVLDTLFDAYLKVLPGFESKTYNEQIKETSELVPKNVMELYIVYTILRNIQDYYEKLGYFLSFQKKIQPNLSAELEEELKMIEKIKGYILVDKAMWKEPLKRFLQSDISACQTCGKNARSLCSGCVKVMYCNTICQEENWKAHEKNCKI